MTLQLAQEKIFPRSTVAKSYDMLYSESGTGRSKRTKGHIVQTVKIFEHEISFVIFDVDGVLLDLYARLWEHYDDTGAAFCLPETSVATYRTRIEKNEMEVPLTLHDGLMTTWKELAHDEELLSRVITYFCALEYKKPYPEVPGSKRLVERLYRRGIVLGLCTSNLPDHLQFKLENIGVSLDWFRVVHTGNKEPQKPDPRALNNLCSVVGVAPEHTLYVGDTQGDARMGLGAGVHFVGVLSGKLPKNEFLRCGVNKKYIMNTAADIPFIL